MLFFKQIIFVHLFRKLKALLSLFVILSIPFKFL